MCCLRSGPSVKLAVHRHGAWYNAETSNIFTVARQLGLFLLVCAALLLSVGVAAESAVVKVKGAAPALAANISASLAGITVLDLQNDLYQARISQMVEQAAQALGYYHSSYQLQSRKGILTVTVQAGDQLH